MEPLSSTACRVLGSLLEKERTVPATYPLTLNALVAAANQTTGRDPVMSLDEADVSGGIDELRNAGLVRLVHPSHGARMIKYRQVADEVLELDAPGRAALTVLVLRGPQTTGEIRSRSERLHEFESVDEVERALERLSTRADPLVSRLDRQPGQKEQRWIHHLSGLPRPVATARSEPGPDRRPVLPVEVPPELAAVAAFVGTWTGDGDGFYPTIAAFGYTEEIELRPVPGKPMLAYRSATRAADDGRTLHGETGFLRVVGTPDRQSAAVELVIAQGGGLVEIAEGVVDDGELVVTSTHVVGTSTAKEVTATERRYRVDRDTLEYELSMAAVGEPIQPHLRAHLKRR